MLEQIAGAGAGAGEAVKKVAEATEKVAEGAGDVLDQKSKLEVEKLPEGMDDCADNLPELSDDLDEESIAEDVDGVSATDVGSGEGVDLKVCTKNIPDLGVPEKGVLSEGNVDGEVSKTKTINDHLVGQAHPDTGVLYKKKIVEDSDGNLVEGVFPEFDSEFDVQLPDDRLDATDKQQADECNAKLKEWCEENPEEAKQKFTEEKLEKIMDDKPKTPDGFTWHHNEEKGLMQLVDTEPHSITRHTGGKAIWGGGSDNR